MDVSSFCYYDCRFERKQIRFHLKTALLIIKYLCKHFHSVQCERNLQTVDSG